MNIYNNNMKVSKQLVCLITMLCVIGANSCKKDLAVSKSDGLVSGDAAIASTVTTQSSQQTISADEINSWLVANVPQALNFKPQNAKQATINNQSVVQVAISTNSAFFFVKGSNGLEVYAYKWLDKRPGVQGFSGNVAVYSFQDNSLKAYLFENGVAKNTGVLQMSVQPSTGKLQVASVSTNKIKVLTTPEFVLQIWCWLKGGELLAGGDVNYCDTSQSFWGAIGDFFSNIFGGGGGGSNSGSDGDGSYGNDGEGNGTYSGNDGSSVSVSTDGGYSSGGSAYVAVTIPCSGAGTASVSHIAINKVAPPDDPSGGCGTVAQWEPITWDTTEVSFEYTPNIEEIDPDDIWWDDTTLDFQKQTLPSFATLNANYPYDASGNEIAGPTVYANVGGAVYASYLQSGNQNACALRLSIALNKSGITIPNIADQTFQGADGKYYFLSSAKIYNFMVKTFKAPTFLFHESDGGPNGSQFESLLVGHKGIFIMRAKDPKQFNAYGHATIYNGLGCAGGVTRCDFSAKGGVSRIALWETPN